jgi:hypothetical protein
MAHVKAPAVVKDELKNLLGGLAKDLNRRIYGDGGIAWGTKFADIEELAVQIGQEISSMKGATQRRSLTGVARAWSCCLVKAWSQPSLRKLV